ncbi:uncharacterized protein HD556DRAFT_1442276 [Suillus plorans]|uniref:Uncharacterized protein n=1 Tax=Suillus plorans TaxID=116603 RepID=A0A9P7DI57_9AGAM|nr:uncharacterized protein HD556DRAFT_1442276 [Suillus plorans]KAG1795423.1 hypothetical protein HD556DRAFT_1442276 [Suillus plorans]
MQSPRNDNTAYHRFPPPLTFTVNELAAALGLIRDQSDQGYDDGDPPAFTLRELGGALTLISDQNAIFAAHDGHDSEELPSPQTEYGACAACVFRAHRHNCYACGIAITSSRVATGLSKSETTVTGTTNPTATTSATESEAAQERGGDFCDVVVQERVKSRTRWRRRGGASDETLALLNHLDDIWFNAGYEPGSNLYQRLESEGLNAVCAADREGWDSLKPEYENDVREVRKLLEQAHGLSTSAGSLEGPYTEQLRVGACEQMIQKMDLCVDSYFEALRKGTLDWQLALSTGK